MNRSIDIVRLLLDNGAEVNCKTSETCTVDEMDKDGLTKIPLYKACRTMDSCVVELLLAHGSEINCNSEWGG
jgi:ankyrin repeat protein